MKKLRRTFPIALLLLLIAACSSKSATAPESKQVGVAPTLPRKPVAVAFVIEGHEMWVGNDKLELPEAERYPGALVALKETFAKVSMKDAPPGSMAALISYGEKATVRHPMSPIAKLTAAAFGEQKHYANVIDRDLVAGITLGLDELAKTKDTQRILVVIGDGTDTNVDAAKRALTALANRAERENVRLLSFIYKGIFSPDGNPLAAFDPDLVTVNAMDAIRGELEALFSAPPPVVPSGQGIALALLVSGQEVWMGNDDLLDADDPSRYHGALKGIRAALGAKAMAGYPPGSVGMILRYDTGLRTQRKVGPIERLDADAIGDQKAYFGTVGTDLVHGVRGSLDQLSKVTATRHVLIVLGDGSDTNNEAAVEQLRALRKTAADRNIEVHAIILKSTLSVDTNVVVELDPKATTAKTADELTAQLTALLGSIR
jgi:hypothetical protein